MTIATDFDEDATPSALPAIRALERFLVSAASAIHVQGAVSVLLTGDRRMRSLNRKYRNKNKPTDVLSFPAAEPAGHRPASVAGDLAISVETAARQAIAFNHPLATELKILILHGLLHLAGFDHETDAGEMGAREMELRRKFRLPGGLIERVTGEPARSRKWVPHPTKRRAAGDGEAVHPLRKPPKPMKTRSGKAIPK